jgi:hypothetical protein
MIPLTNYDSSEGEHAEVVMKFTQIDDANILQIHREKLKKQHQLRQVQQFQEFGSHIDIEKTANQLSKP